jgi:hypothetical protein
MRTRWRSPSRPAACAVFPARSAAAGPVPCGRTRSAFGTVSLTLKDRANRAPSPPARASGNRSIRRYGMPRTYGKPESSLRKPMIVPLSASGNAGTGLTAPTNRSAGRRDAGGSGPRAAGGIAGDSATVAARRSAAAHGTPAGASSPGDADPSSPGKTSLISPTSTTLTHRAQGFDPRRQSRRRVASPALGDTHLRDVMSAFTFINLIFYLRRAR